MHAIQGSEVSPLVEAGVLHAALGDPDWIVVDCRHELADTGYGRRAYAEGHIPGALFLHIDEDLSGPLRAPDGRFRGRHPLPDREAFSRRLALTGLTPNTTLVAYDDSDGMYAARLWWLARWIGHERVSVLDGGLKAWRECGYAITTELPSPRSAAISHLAPVSMPTIDADTLLAGLADGKYRILDARAPERYRGEVEPLDANAGHIPGAHNRVFRSNLRADGRFKAPEELHAEFAEAVSDFPVDRVVHQCGSGVTACHNLLAMAVAGMPGALLYPGSWSEWSSDPSRPIATGGDP